MPSVDASSVNEILSFLRSKNLISDHKSHSAKESQTLDNFIEKDVSRLMNELLRPLKRKFQFYSNTRHFKQ